MKRLLPLFLSLCFIFFLNSSLTGLPVAIKPVDPEQQMEKGELWNAEKQGDLHAGVKLNKKQQKKLEKKKAKLRKKLARRGVDTNEFESIEGILDEPFFRLGLICILASIVLSLVGGLLFGLGGIFYVLSGILALVGIVLLILALLQVV